jgi:hypothetical protein
MDYLQEDLANALDDTSAWIVAETKDGNTGHEAKVGSGS